jgi:hypothetical protein
MVRGKSLGTEGDIGTGKHNTARNKYYTSRQPTTNSKATYHGGHVLGEAVDDAAHRRGVKPTRGRVHHRVDQAIVQVLCVCVKDAEGAGV